MVSSAAVLVYCTAIVAELLAKPRSHAHVPGRDGPLPPASLRRVPGALLDAVVAFSVTTDLPLRVRASTSV